MSGGDMSLDQRVTSLEIEVAQLRTALQGITGNWPTPPRLVMSWPCGDITRRQLAPWFDATGYATLYNGGKAYHTGHDLNLSAYGDSGKPVASVADGMLRFIGKVSGWQGDVVIIEHALEDGRLFWTRYAHIDALPALQVNSRIMRGTTLGNIADYTPKGPQGDHLHIDGAWCDLGKKPGDWPGLDLARLKVDYFDLLKMIEERLP